MVGRVADIVGARRVFLAGVVVFGATSLLAGLAPDRRAAGARALPAGGGAAMILPTSLALLNASFTGKARGQAFAVWGSTIGAATALGPLLGGWLSEHASWRWAFGINIPLVDRDLCRRAGVPGPLAAHAPAGSTSSVRCCRSLGLGLLAFGLIEGRDVRLDDEPSSRSSVFGATWDPVRRRCSSRWCSRPSLIALRRPSGRAEPRRRPEPPGR